MDTTTPTPERLELSVMRLIPNSDGKIENVTLSDAEVQSVFLLILILLFLLLSSHIHVDVIIFMFLYLWFRIYVSLTLFIYEVVNTVTHSEF